MNYIVPQIPTVAPAPEHEAILIASGDLRLAANQVCWPAQKDMEDRVTVAFAREGITVRRGHSYDPAEKHGFISSTTAADRDEGGDDSGRVWHGLGGVVANATKPEYAP